MLISVFLCSMPGTYSQEISLKGIFLQDTVKIGEQVPYSLSATYPRTYNLIFPDSSYDYRPFEFHRRTYFNTISDSVMSFDSVVYYLSTFEIDTTQYLQLPVFLIQNEDSTALYAQPDSIELFHVIRTMPDSVKLKENTSFLRIPDRFNYPLFLWAAAILFVVILLTMIFFGRRLTRWISLLIMQRTHRRFVKRFNAQLSGLRDRRAGFEPEDVLSAWKKYMEKLEKEPYTKLTTKELISLHADQRLKENLRSVDRYIYGNIKEKPLHEHFEKLLEYAIERYEVRTNELRNG